MECDDDRWTTVVRKSKTNDSNTVSQAATQPQVIVSQPEAQPLQPSIATSSNDPLFNRIHNDVVQRVLSSWKAYQAAVHDELGGPKTAEKDAWLGEVLTQHLIDIHESKDKSLATDVDDLSDWIDDILDEEFNLIVEDGTIESASNALLRASALLHQQNQTSNNGNAPNMEDVNRQLEQILNDLKL
ncbi:pre-rRNA-processing protein TSR2 domain-containing protein [Ditylenchus destructor]|nr:pre-rRNA-processing protein TSR2 domain-containing protein [Ditylenchus destructor]